MGESITEGTISKWLKKPGDQVKKYEGLVEVITDPRSMRQEVFDRHVVPDEREIATG